MDREDNERDIFDFIDSISKEEIEKELEGIVEEGKDMDIDNIKLERIKKKTYSKVGVTPIKAGKKPKHKYKLVASLLLALLVSTAALNHDIVLAQVKRALMYIPGMNSVVHDSKGDTYILKSSAKIEVNGGYIEVKGMVADGERTVVTIVGEGIKAAKNISFMDANGETYKADIYSVGSGGDTWEGSYMHRGFIDPSKQIYIILEDYDNYNIAVNLQKAELFQSYDEIGPTTVKNNIGITAIPLREEGRLKLNLISSLKDDMRIHSYGGHVNHEKETVKLLGRDDREYTVSMPGSYSILDTFYFDISQTNERNFKLEVPYIIGSYNHEEKIKLNIPKEGTIDIGETISLGDFPIEFTKIERIDREVIRVYVDTKYNKDSYINLIEFGLDGTKLPKNSCSWLVDPETNAIQFYDINIKERMKSITLYLKEATVEVRGPWILDIDL